MHRSDQLLSDFFDGHLTAAERDEFAELLRQNPQLQAEFVELYQLHRLLAIELKPFAAELFEAAVFAELHRDQEEFVGSVMRRLGAGRSGNSVLPVQGRRAAPDATSWLHRFELVSWFPRWSGAALATSLAIVTAIIAFRELRPEPVRAWAREVNGPAIVQRGARRLAAREGIALRQGDVLETPAEGTLALEYRDEATRVELRPGSSLRLGSSRRGKRLELLAGRMEATVAPQPRDRPMVLVTRLAEARVLGTRFSLMAKPASTRLVVTEGTVQLTRVADRQSVKTGPGEYAVAATGLELATHPVNADSTADEPVPVRIAWFSEYPEDEDWITAPRFVQQRRTYGDSFHAYRAPPLEGSVQLEVLVRVDELAPGVAWNGIGWGFGIGLRCARDPAALMLRSLQQGAEGSVLELADGSAGHPVSAPLEHPPGWYQLKLRLDRRPGGQVELRGKLWRQFELEPEAWMVSGTATGEGPVAAIGLSTRNCACTFAQLSLSFIE
jgi:ferric-dicitrate binding protein FerR (iron transport regulator)